jgi:hypothetical protein
VAKRLEETRAVAGRKAPDLGLSKKVETVPRVVGRVFVARLPGVTEKSKAEVASGSYDLRVSGYARAEPHGRVVQPYVRAPRTVAILVRDRTSKVAGGVPRGAYRRCRSKSGIYCGSRLTVAQILETRPVLYN